METVNATLPSTVFADVAAHRVRPNRRPIIEAWVIVSEVPLVYQRRVVLLVHHQLRESIHRYSQVGVRVYGVINM